MAAMTTVVKALIKADASQMKTQLQELCILVLEIMIGLGDV